MEVETVYKANPLLRHISLRTQHNLQPLLPANLCVAQMRAIDLQGLTVI
jgi:hypothetical protein